MSVLPIVSPAHNADGIALQPILTALYPFALDEGSIDSTTCFLVRKHTSSGSNTTNQVPVKVELKRIQLTGTSEFTGSDDGSGSDAGVKYRSQIIITPATLLKDNADYSVILSKDLAKRSVFDVKANASNVGAGVPLVKGPFTGLSNDQYKIDITTGGNENSTKFKVTRLSDNFVINNLSAKKRFIEVEKGVFVKFDTGSYLTGDSYTVVVKPLVKTNEIYSWDFSTGDSNYTVPSDDNSTTVIDLPVNDGSGPVVNPNAPFKLVSVSPSPDSIMNSPTNKIVTFTFNKNIKPDSMTAEKVKLIAESTATNFYGPLDHTFVVQDNKLIITFA